ncbi:nudix hydrolase 5-like [Hyposmocoma kahamanoa]|uniref:nudix hydrolase 5-like n=1 Tax=Hyposmocoma kahamanoa TaxID=1477025 RepID=UPI000E6D84DA|nr:nudix hydrolase 5-like [Hyposmocoma kahamanoa]
MISLKSKFFYHSYTLCVLAFKTPVRKQILNMKRHAFIPCCRYAGQASQEIFSGKIDIFKGITVDTATLKCEKDKFEKILVESLKQWNIEGKRCIWFKVNIGDACYVPILAKKGFNFHHARGDFVMMYKWLPKDVKANLPPSSYTNVGVGAMVFNKEGNLLTLSEKSYDYAHWKLPGGYVEKGGAVLLKPHVVQILAVQLRPQELRYHVPVTNAVHSHCNFGVIFKKVKI